MEYPKFKVCCRCFTFNHSKYITDAMNGFTMQKTSFPFVCTIVDDASTDGEQDVIRKYVDEQFDFSEGSVSFHKETDYAYITYAQHKTNKNCYFAVLYLKENLYSKKQSFKKLEYISEWRDGVEYMALCEGDDYWIVPDKLEKQVKFLDSHHNYYACLTRFYKYKQSEKKMCGIGGNKRETIKEMLWKDVQFGTATILFNYQIYLDYREEIQPQNQNWLMGDKPLFFYLGYRGRVKTLPLVSSVYRILETSASHSNDINLQLKRARNTIDIYHYYAKKYLNENDKWFRKIEGGYLYRAYHIFKDSNESLPEKLESDIKAYYGYYWKLYIVKLFLKYPKLHSFVYFFVNLKNMLALKISNL